ncbi:class I SAM-dependent methyltransferase [Seonamhaeicola aphaedonensis]|uniref:Methyltransferase family protein n=1 Tax=Seonamhaeicola aphaedonensis TaxID=1461338 RepID=A0A3D9HHI4_9FLAO|nr:class I SAM-dependent methyltransferase [Seonamhaeicola aphaedonensis]RED48969.1 methyltransferase family protein [Seonamhaeicola aphaedonensis]
MNRKPVFLTVKDHSVSGEIFELIQNPTYGYLETTPPPKKEKLQEYYKSEDYISHTDSKRNLFEKVYHWVRVLALKKKVILINSFHLESKNLLDVGCGTGDFLYMAKRNGWTVFGIEPNEKARAIANSKTPNSVFEIEKLFSDLKEASFDVITLWHVLEHLPQLENQIKNFQKLLKPNGVLIIAAPNFKSYDAKYYKEFWAAYDVPRHLWHFNRSSVSSLFSKMKMQVIKIKPMWFDAFYVSLLSEKYKTDKMNVIKGFYIGALSNLKALKTKEASSLIYIIKNI